MEISSSHSNAIDSAYIRVTILCFIQLRVDVQTLWTGACVDPRVGAAVRPCLGFVSESRIRMEDFLVTGDK